MSRTHTIHEAYPDDSKDGYERNAHDHHADNLMSSDKALESPEAGWLNRFRAAVDRLELERNVVEVVWFIAVGLVVNC